MNILVGGVAVDDRGSVRFVNDFDFKGVKRFYQIENHRKFVRAWHGHKNEGKYVYVARGSAVVGAVPIDGPNPASPDYKDHILKGWKPERFVLSAQAPKILWMPPGYYNGFMTLEDDTIVMFYSTSTLEESKSDDIRLPYDTWDIWDVEKR